MKGSGCRQGGYILAALRAGLLSFIMPRGASAVLGGVFGGGGWMEGSSGTGADKKSLMSTFECFLTATAKVYFLEGRLGAGLCLHPNLRFP